MCFINSITHCYFFKSFRLQKRNKKKLVSPSKFDNSVAGGVRAGEGIFDALEREAYEEAGLKKEQLNNVKLVGTLNYNWKNSE